MNYISKLLFIFVTAVFCNCSNNNSFTGDKEAAEAAPPAQQEVESKSDAGGDASAIGGTNIREEFNLQSTSQKIDMTWVIDNSTSMDNEIDEVKRNFSKFLKQLDSMLDIQVSLISSKPRNDPLAVLYNKYTIELPNNLPSNLKVFHQDMIVGSYDSLMIAALASCESTSSDLKSDRICGKDIPDIKQQINNFDPINNVSNSIINQMLDYYNTARGGMHNFYRSNAKRVYVFVTDDNAHIATKHNFLELIEPYTNGIQPTIYGFVGMSKTNCKIDNISDSYIELAKKTGGRTFDICETDWSQYFDELTENVQNLANTNFQLEKTPKSIIEVSINGTKLDASDYRVTGRTLIVNQDALSDTTGTLLVVYDD